MKNIKTVLFDLDGTLLPMDADRFTSIYFDEMGAHFKAHTHPDIVKKNIWQATKAMVMSTDKVSNEKVFWKAFKEITNNDPNFSEEHFEAFYETGYQKTKDATSVSQAMIEAVRKLKEKNIEVVVATNPLFPRKAIHDRIQWAGFEPSDFTYITSFEESNYCKPQIFFYQELLEIMNRNPEECLMVGNDCQEDLIAGKLGIKTWLITDCIINREEGEPKADYKGTAEDFLAFAEKM
ncbi:MAG: HAD family hydrolase [Bacillota bacterium]